MSEYVLGATFAALSMLLGVSIGRWLARRKATNGVAVERRSTTFAVDQEKFSTQRNVTYALLVIFACVSAYVLNGNDQSERSMVLQTIINLTLLAVGYWLGASKAAADSGAALSRVAEAAPKQQERAVAAARGPAPDEPVPPPPEPGTPAPMKPVDTLTVDATGADISINDGNVTKEQK